MKNGLLLTSAVALAVLVSGCIVHTQPAPADPAPAEQPAPAAQPAAAQPAPAPAPAPAKPAPKMGVPKLGGEKPNCPEGQHLEGDKCVSDDPQPNQSSGAWNRI